ncbi:MAG: hypothetical protein ACMXYF_00820 [Candidatus Woesearchaeota archaeon]
MQKRGQVSIEYLLLMGFALIAILGAAALAFLSFSDFEQSVRENQVQSSLQSIVEQSQLVYGIGPNSFRVITITLPTNVDQILIAQNTITARMHTSGGLNDIVFFSTVPLQGTIDAQRGTKTLRVTAFDNHVQIEQI